MKPSPVLAFTLLAAALGLAACENTVRGAGQDLQETGAAVESGAQEAGEAVEGAVEGAAEGAAQ